MKFLFHEGGAFVTLHALVEESCGRGLPTPRAGLESPARDS